MEVIEIKSAKELLEVISLDNKKLNGFCTKSIFRGHADSSWLAIPSAFREEGDLLSDRELAPIGVRTNREQIEAEFHTLSLFIEELNLNGFHVPNEDVLRLDTNTTQFFNFIKSNRPWRVRVATEKLPLSYFNSTTLWYANTFLRLYI